jgi:signal transduction histidine kinase
MAAVIGTVAPEAKLGHPGAHIGALVLVCLVVVSWVAWLKARDGDHQVGVVLSLVVLAVVGGSLTPLAPAAISVGAVIGVGVGTAFSLPTAVAIAAAGPAASLVSGAVTGRSLLIAAAFAGTELGGMVIGVSRRQAQLQVEQRAQVDLERERAQLEYERAELLGERNRLAREIHDVLAHTLSAVAVQVEAIDAVVGHEDDQALHARLQSTRGLVIQGLDEARRAVAALRDDARRCPSSSRSCAPPVRPSSTSRASRDR